MNATVSSEDLTQYEQRGLAQLEKDNGTGMGYISQLAPSNVLLPPDKIAAIVNYVADLERHFISYNPAALYLKNVGRPRLFDRLQRILNDLRQSKTIYVQMYEDALTTQQRTQAIPHQVSTDWLKATQDALDRQKQAFDQSFRQWQASFNHTCPYCNYYMGDSYFSTDICPRCGRLLRGGYL
jgi:hypothetical protein